MNNKSQLRLKLDEMLSNFRNDLDYITESINIHTDIDFFNMERAKLIEQSNQISKEKNQDIENGLYPNVIYKDFRLYVFKSTLVNDLINTTSFNILRYYIDCNKPIILLNELHIKIIKHPFYLYLLDHDIFEHLNITFNYVNTEYDRLTIEYSSNNNCNCYKEYLEIFKCKNPFLVCWEKNLFEIEEYKYYKKSERFGKVFINKLISEYNSEQIVNKITIESLYRWSKELLTKVYINDLEYISSLKKLSIYRIKIKEDIKISTLSNNLEWLTLHTEDLNFKTLLYDDVGKLKYLNIKALICPKINCPNLESLEINANDIILEKDLTISLLKITTLNDVCLKTILSYSNLTILELNKVFLSPEFSFTVLYKLKEIKINTCSNYIFHKNIFSGLTLLRKVYLSQGTLIFLIIALKN